MTPPIYDIHCLDCGEQQEQLVFVGKDVFCQNCQSINTEKLVGTFGGYHIKGDNSASVRPKGAGSRKSNE